DAHGAHSGRVDVSGPMPDVAGAITMRQKHLDVLAHHPLARITKHLLRLFVDDSYAPAGIDNDHGVRRCVEQVSKERVGRLYGAQPPGYFGVRNVPVALAFSQRSSSADFLPIITALP